MTMTMTMQFLVLSPILLSLLAQFSSGFIIHDVMVVSRSSSIFRQHQHHHQQQHHEAQTRMLLVEPQPSIFKHGYQPTSQLVASSSSSSRMMMMMAADDDTQTTAAKSVTGEELERMLQEWDTPLVVDAYATWCGPCLLMAPEFESAASSLIGKVRFVKLDTDLEPQMASRLGIMGLPTLLFLDKNKEDAEAVAEGKAPAAVLKERIEGALRKQSIVDLCMYHFFEGPMPTSLS